MYSNYEKHLFSQYVQNAFNAWVDQPKLINEFSSWFAIYIADEFDVSYRKPVTVIKKKVGEHFEIEKKDRTRLTIGDRNKLGKAINRAVRKYAQYAQPDNEYLFLRNIVAYLGYDETDQKLCEFFLLSRKNEFNTILRSSRERMHSEGRLEPAVAFVAAFAGVPQEMARAHLRSSAPLMKTGLVFLEDESDYGDPDDLVSIPYYLHPKIMNKVKYQEFDITSAVSFFYGEPRKATVKWEDFSHVRTNAEYAASIIKGAVEKKKEGVNILVYGETGTGKTEFALVLAARLGLSIYAVGTKDMDELDDLQMLKPIERIADMRLIQNLIPRDNNASSLLLFDEMEDLLGDEMIFMTWKTKSSLQVSKAAVLGLLEGNRTPVVYTTNDIERFDPALLRRFSLVIELETPTPEVRQRILTRTLSRYGMELTALQIDDIARQYSVPPALYSKAVESVSLATPMEGGSEKIITGLNLVLKNSSRLVVDEDIAEHHKLVPDFDLGLINADRDIAKLTEQLKNSANHNYSLCLYGPPGTGKSEYAVFLAYLTKMETIDVDYGAVSSKWVGETEKKLRHLFERASDEKKFLIFNEADSLLSNREEAQQTWERSQVNQMLRLMEKHKYPFVCTTNLQETIDRAAVRRFTFDIEFKAYTEERAAAVFNKWFGFGVPAGIVLPRNLTLGDFAKVRNQARITGIEKNPAELVYALAQEAQIKKVRRHPSSFELGFGGAKKEIQPS